MFQLYDYILMLFIIIVFMWGVKFHNLPKLFVVLGILSGLLSHVVLNGFGGLLFSTVGIVAGTSVGLILYYLKAFGIEDVTLFAVFGAFLGFANIMYFALYTIFFALIIGAIILATTRLAMMNKLCNKCMERLYSFTSIRYNPIVLQLEKRTISFPVMYAVIPAIIVHYIATA